MIELAFDTATAACTVALRRADGELFEITPPPARLTERPAHTTELLSAILEVTARAGVELGDVDRLAVGVGPGAFTGLRIGVATARAIATANGIELTPVSSLAALSSGEVTPVIDARRNEFFFRIGDEDRLAGPEQAISEIAAAGLPSVGDGAIKLRTLLTDQGVPVPPGDDPIHLVRAARTLDLGRELSSAKPDDVVPNYIRPPDAKVSSRESWLVGAPE
ncbi:MAG: tRNA (adenosine(37)-N6)-threonylcarbamoyltransferase complex dimerization subunit type 1 TsaB [Solirubrobacterales bacterium]|nr:tRNA (adenosine(37)-N6)-threonylcarbamoyltransferase complex dimerization subunit type 1 TsaB [Solirubrobacterales bacterium]